MSWSMHVLPEVVKMDALAAEHMRSCMWSDAAAKAERHNSSGFSKCVFKLCFKKVGESPAWLEMALDPTQGLLAAAREVPQERATAFGNGVVVSAAQVELAEQAPKRRRASRPEGAPAATTPGL